MQPSTTAQRSSLPLEARDQNTTAGVPSKQISSSASQTQNSQRNEPQSFPVISIGDGDTLRVDKDGEIITIRLACIDSPELKQHPYGEQAKQRLQAILPNGIPVSLKEQTVDRYDRVVAEVFKDDINVNLSLVTEGHAVAYRKYLNQCDAENYLTAEDTAKAKGLAFWSQATPIMPWDFRRGKISTQPKQSPEISDSNCDRTYPEVCIPSAPPDLDCGDIPHRRFKVIGDDPHRFDGDGNGIGCEN